MTVPVNVVPLYLAVMVAVPTPFAVITPVFPTVATDVLLDVHVSFAYFGVALEGAMVAVTFAVLPASNVTAFWLNVTESTLIPVAFTVTVAVFFEVDS